MVTNPLAGEDGDGETPYIVIMNHDEPIWEAVLFAEFDRDGAPDNEFKGSREQAIAWAKSWNVPEILIYSHAHGDVVPLGVVHP